MAQRLRRALQLWRLHQTLLEARRSRLGAMERDQDEQILTYMTTSAALNGDGVAPFKPTHRWQQRLAANIRQTEIRIQRHREDLVALGRRERAIHRYARMTAEQERNASERKHLEEVSQQVPAAGIKVGES